MSRWRVRERLYTIDELAPRVVEELYRDWLEGRDYPYSDEALSTVQHFCDLFGLQLHEAEFDVDDYRVRYTIPYSDEVSGLTGARLAAFIWNRFGDKLFPPRRYRLVSRSDSGSVTMKVYESHVFRSKLEYMSGYWLDEVILRPVYSFLETLNPWTRRLVYYLGYHFDDLIEDCIYEWWKACRSDIEHCLGFETFLEDMREEGRAFDAYGNYRDPSLRLPRRRPREWGDLPPFGKIPIRRSMRRRGTTRPNAQNVP